MTTFMHTMIRVTDLDATLDFFRLLDITEVRRKVVEQARFTLVFLAAPGQEDVAEVELTYNWPPADGSPGETYGGGRNFGHLAYGVDDIYAVCQRLSDAGVTIYGNPDREGGAHVTGASDIARIVTHRLGIPRELVADLSSAAEVAHGNALGLDMIVTDHHSIQRSILAFIVHFITKLLQRLTKIDCCPHVRVTGRIKIKPELILIPKVRISLKIIKQRCPRERR